MSQNITSKIKLVFDNLTIETKHKILFISNCFSISINRNEMLEKAHNIEADSSGSEDNSAEEENQMETEQNNSESDNDEPAAEPSGLNEKRSKKKKKRGIIYLSSIPKYMNVTILREMLSQYAKIGRIFLQPGKLSGEFQTL